ARRAPCHTRPPPRESPPRPGPGPPPAAALLREHRDHGIGMLAVGREPDAEALDRRDDGIVERRLHVRPLALVADVAVQIVDLGAAFLLHVLQERGLATAALPCDVGDVGEELAEPAAVV